MLADFGGYAAAGFLYFAIVTAIAAAMVSFFILLGELL